MAKDHRKKEEIMCTIGRISGGTARETYHCGNRKEGALRHGKEEWIAAPSGAVIFLNTTFTPMPPPELFSESPDGKPCNLITRENYEYLRDSFFQICESYEKGSGTCTGTHNGGRNNETA